MSTSTPNKAPPDAGSKPSGFAIWLTGLPGSGKTTIARHLQRRLAESHVLVELLDSDDLRTFMTPNPQYDESERELFYRAIGCLAMYLTRHNVNVVIAATAHRQQSREDVRQRIERFFEVHVDCPLAICEQRDPKGLYRRARRGEIEFVPGMNVAYEAPISPDLTVRTSQLTVDESTDQILQQLKDRGWITA